MAVSIAESILSQRKRGFIPNDWSCNCGDPNCENSKRTDTELRIIYDGYVAGLKSALSEQLAYSFMYVSIFFISLLVISFMLTHQNQF